MTKLKLVINVFGVLLFLLILIFSACVAKYKYEFHALYDAVRDFASIIIAGGAAYLTYCFQRRQAFLTSLRELWMEMIEAKAELIQYTFIEDPKQEDFGRVHRALSKAIDLTRGVYRNSGEDQAHIGYFPLEPLHDMVRVLDSFGFANRSLEERSLARMQIISSWNCIRWAFLKEFSTPAMRDAITTQRQSDPRRGRKTRLPWYYFRDPTRRDGHR